MGVAFSDGANFRRMLVDKSNGLRISEVRHKTLLKVSEEGTTAAVATSVRIITRISAPPPLVLVNRPFLFLIRDKSSNAVLFIGRVANP